MRQLSDNEIEKIYLAAKDSGRIQDHHTATIFYATPILDDRLQTLTKHFPDNSLHAIAIKANSSPEVLKYLAEKGFGLEAASMEEVQLAVNAGVEHHKIVYDSPVKTREEIQYCHEHLPGMMVNANSLEELARYPQDFSGQLGLRINPLIHSDAPNIFNVSGKASKFGVPISKENAIIEACLDFQKITGLHFHVGSGIRNYKANVQAAKLITGLAKKINIARDQKGIASRIEFIDIGGGIKFSEYEGDHSVEDYVLHLKEETKLFTDYKVITEFGKYVHADAGFVVSEIEYVLQGESESAALTAFIHVGADLFVRKIYSDLAIHYPYSVIRSSKNKALALKKHNVAGPLCFSGDFLYHNIEMQQVEEGDKFVIHRTGANTLSMWSHHCSRKVPKLIVV
ncbi:MAG: hypothetical protein GY751_26680 [Bacteroidetes bacterium]|nr:hypothetical protein [Bacteroidota bacterium]